MPGPLTYAPGVAAEVNGRACTIKRVVDPARVLVRFRDDDRSEVVEVTELAPPGAGEGTPRPPALDSLSAADHASAAQKFAIIEPLLGLSSAERGKAVTEVAAAHGVSRSTVFSWIRAYRDGGALSALAPKRPKKRKQRLSKKVEAIVADTVRTHYLTSQRLSKKRVFEEVQKRCRTAKLACPSEKTVRQRIDELDEREKLKRRRGAKAARDKFAEIKGHFPGADYPLAVVQIDHTLLDVILVDDEDRQPIGRPWLTLAVDVFSRMVAGIYLSLDPPSAFSVGMCVRHAVLHKNQDLDRLDVKGKWPVWGLMTVLHADNGKDFRSATIKRACQQHGINLEWRPVKTPHYGGHVERLLGTLAKLIHALPGTTFSNIAKRGIYDSDKTAVMTFDEMEKWLTECIVNRYHLQKHSALDMSPFEKWELGICGDGNRKGIGLPAPIPNPDQLRIDFLPMTERTVQRDGISWDKVTYFDSCLRPWINARRGREKIKFIVRRDPRDISRIWFFDPKIGRHLAVPYRNYSRPTISLWELRAATRRARNKHDNAVNENTIFAAYEEMGRIVETSAAKTRKQRMEKQRRKQRGKSLSRDTANDPAEPSGPGPRLVIDNRSDAVARPAGKAKVIYEFTDDELADDWEEWK